MRVKCKIEEIECSGDSKDCCTDGDNGVRASLFVARKSKNVLLVYYISKRKQCITHKLKDNVMCIFKQHMKAGKATIQLKEPSVNICVRDADNFKLQRLLFAINRANAGDSLCGHRLLSRITPATETHMIIKIHQKYPPSEGFPLSLKKLKISDRRLEQLDPRIFELEHLVELGLSHNSFRNIPEALWKMKNLYKLDLSYNSITDIPEALRKMKNLSILNLTYNRIEYLPETAFSQDSNLTALHLKRNEIKSLPNSICELKNLRYLNVTSNSIRYLPMRIGNLKKLKTLLVADNHLMFLPASLWQLRLNSIDICWNDFFVCSRSPVCNRATTNVIPTLQQLAGRIIKKFKIKSVGFVPDTIMRYLNFSLRCCCETYCFEDHIVYADIADLSALCHKLKNAYRLPSNVYFKVGACSQKCLTLWKENVHVRKKMNYD